MRNESFNAFMGGFLSVVVFGVFILLTLSLGGIYFQTKEEIAQTALPIIPSIQMENATRTPEVISPTPTFEQGIAYVVIVDSENQVIPDQAAVYTTSYPANNVIVDGGIVDQSILLVTTTPTVVMDIYLPTTVMVTEVPVANTVVQPEPTYSQELVDYALSTTIEEWWDLAHTNQGMIIAQAFGITPQMLIEILNRPCMGGEQYAITMAMADGIAGKQLPGRGAPEIFMDAAVISPVFSSIGVWFPAQGQVRVNDSAVTSKLIDLALYQKTLKYCVDVNGDPVAYGQGIIDFADWLIKNHYSP